MLHTKSDIFIYKICCFYYYYGTVLIGSYHHVIVPFLNKVTYFRHCEIRKKIPRVTLARFLCYFKCVFNSVGPVPLYVDYNFFQLPGIRPIHFYPHRYSSVSSAVNNLERGN